MGKSEKNKSNSITAQWAIPTILLMLFLIFTLINYNKTMEENSKEKALDRVSRQAVSVAGYYRGLYEGMSNSADALADYLMNEDDIFSERAVELIKQFDDHTGLIDAYIVKSNGNAVDSYGNSYVTVDTSEDFKSLLGTKDNSVAVLDEKTGPYLCFRLRSERRASGAVISCLFIRPTE